MRPSGEMTAVSTRPGGAWTPSTAGGNVRMRSLNAYREVRWSARVSLRRVVRFHAIDRQQGREFRALAPGEAHGRLRAEALAFCIREARLRLTPEDHRRERQHPGQR